MLEESGFLKKRLQRAAVKSVNERCGKEDGDADAENPERNHRGRSLRERLGAAENIPFERAEGGDLVNDVHGEG